jgi:adenosylcobinamide-GDP ribazoletransferase
MKRLILAVQFLTVLPIKKSLEPSPDELTGSMAFFPVVGALQGLVLVIAYYILSAMLPPPVVSALLIVILAVTNGGLHLDGLSDTMDGLAGGSTPEERLRIMRDSSIGALGVVSIVLVLLVKYAALSSVPADLKPGVLLIFPMAGRWAMVPLSYWGVYARDDGGTGQAFTGASSKIFLSATVIMAISSLFILGFRTLLVLVFIGAVAYAVSVFFKGKLGGVTGDVFGFLSESSEVLFLLGALIMC